MKLSFDKFERYEMPQVTLCNPNSRVTEIDGKITITDTVGVLSNPKGMNLKLNFNAPHELSFDYYRHKSTDPIKQSFYDSIYDSIQTDRYIYLTDIGYFVISSVTDSDEDNIDKKSISLKSCEENELATAEGLHLKEGTYYLHTDNNDGLLDLFLPKTAGWTMGYIDPALLTKPYFVEETEVDNGYNFLYTTIQDMFECIVEPDIIRRTISAYSRAYYTEHHLTDIHIAKYNLLKHKTVEENDEDKYTALNVQGKDENLEIRAVNPTGKNVIYNFEPRYSWMSSALQRAIEKWQEKCESVEDEYLTLQQGYYTELEKLFNEEQDIEVLKGELKTLEETRDAVLITTGEEQSTALDNVNVQISVKQTEINTATSNYNSHQATIQTTYEKPINQINSDCALDITAKDIDGNTIFTAELLNELMTHIKPTDYVDEYMLVTESMTYPQRFEKAKELMNRAQSQLVKISSGQKTYSIDTRSFLFNKQFKHFSKQLCAGAIIYVETKNDIMEQLHLTGIGINFDEKSADFTLGNKYDRSDLKALYEDALGKNSKSFNELKYIASIIEDQQKQLDYQKNWVADLRTLTLDNVLTSEDQAIEINNRGLIGRKRQLEEDGSWAVDENNNPLFELEQVKLINNTLIFTEDNWNTASTAVGKIAVGYNADGSIKYVYGINGQVLIGELILGNNLVLTGTGAGIKITDSSGNNAFYADEDGNLVLSGKIFANDGDIAGWKINQNTIEKTVYNGTKIDGNNDLLQMDFIQGDGANYIELSDIFPTHKTGFEIEFELTEKDKFNSNAVDGYSIILGACDYSDTNKPARFYLSTCNTTLSTSITPSEFSDGTNKVEGRFTRGYLIPDKNLNSSGLTSNTINKRIRVTLTVNEDNSANYTTEVIDSEGNVIEKIKEGKFTDTSEFQSTIPLRIFDMDETNKSPDSNYYAYAKVYSVKITEYDKVIRNLVPCYEISTEKKGFYDTVNQKTYLASYSYQLISNKPVCYTKFDSTTGSIYSNNIIAEGGIIGSWRMIPLKDSGNNLVGNALFSNPTNSLGTGMSATTYSSDPAFWAGYAGNGNTPWDDDYWASKTNFYVTNSGQIVAKNAKIDGGTIAGWDIKGSSIQKMNSEQTKYFFIEAGTGSSWLYASTRENKDAAWTRKFSVSTDGKLYATGADITGTINATSGTFTGTIKANGGNFGAWQLKNYNNEQGCMYATDSYGYPIYLGNFGVSAYKVEYGEADTEAVTWGDIVFVAYNYSDEKLKKDIVDFNSSHDVFFDLIQPKEFRYNNRRKSGSVNKLHFGFIYQNIKDSAEQANINDLSLHWLKPDGYGNVNKQEIIALNTWQIQKLKKRVVAAESRITELENTVAELKTQIQTLTAG